MSRHIPIRDASGQVNGFQQILDQTMQQLGATPAPSPAPATSPAAPATSPPAPSWRDQIADAVADLENKITPQTLAISFGMLIAMLIISAISWFGGQTTTAEATPPIVVVATRTPAPQPTAAPQQDAYAAPGGARLGPIPADTPLTYQDSRSPDWAGVDWEGQIVWVRTPNDTTALIDLAPPPIADAPSPPIADAPPPPIADAPLPPDEGAQSVVPAPEIGAQQIAPAPLPQPTAVQRRPRSIAEAAKDSVRAVCETMNLVTDERDVFYRDTLVGHVTGQGCDPFTAALDADAKEAALLLQRAQP